MGKAKSGRPPKPVEVKRLAGNPGRRKLPVATVVIPMASSVPVPHRPLGKVGQQFWDRVWSVAYQWISPHMDVELLQIVCEQIDERQALRGRVLRGNDWRERSSLRALDAQVLDCLSLLGFTPVDRARLGFVEVKRLNELDTWRERNEKPVKVGVVEVGEPVDQW